MSVFVGWEKQPTGWEVTQYFDTAREAAAWRGHDRNRRIRHPKARRNPRKVKGVCTTLRNMASLTITKQRNGVVRITGRKMRGRR